MGNILRKILSDLNIGNNKITDSTLENLAKDPKVDQLSQSIVSLKSQLVDILNMHQATEDFKESHLIVPNAFVKKDYQFTFNLSEFPSISIKEIKNLDKIGLSFNSENGMIFGTPNVANSLEIEILFYNNLEENTTEHSKKIYFIVNADPKDLWLDKPSPKDHLYYKVENTSHYSTFLDKKIVVCSKRGRSHAHNGTFREDDFHTKNLPNGWAIIAVADGAGSSKFARAGSQLATEFIVKSFDNEELLNNLSQLATSYYSKENNLNFNIQDKKSIINTLYKNVKLLSENLVEFSETNNLEIRDLHTTLIFTLVKKFSFGYVILSFGVGDCPINVISKDESSVKLLNYLDVGESSGSTRFITMPEIFSDQEMMIKRFGINCFDDFSKLILMTDGIYDPKFVVESKLENSESWKEFLNDLDGNNEDQSKVNFENDNNIETELSDWMDFWSKGNHDDRTLAIIY